MIKIISSNIRFDNPNDGLNVWENRIDLISDTFTQINPIILGTQEGREPQLRELEQKLNHKIIDVNRQWINERMYPSLYLNENSNSLVSGDFWLSETPNIAGSKSFNSAFPRLCTWSKLFYKDYFYVFNVHLDHIYDYTRYEQARVLRDQIRRINWDNRPFILMGDFNSSPDSKVYEFLMYTLNLQDPWRQLGLDEEPSYHMFQGHLPSATRIDWILLSKHFKALNIQLIKDNKNGIYLSDHYPVLCEIDLK
jgi:endonuclease/exonuclease/phosphatase family metal-dependent hydrolase